MTPHPSSGTPSWHATLFRHWRRSAFAAVLALALAIGLVSPAMALSAQDFPGQLPANHVLDEAKVFSRASALEIERELEGFADERVDAKVITISRLDYDLTLHQLGEDLLGQWQGTESGVDVSNPSLLLLLIDGQTRATAIVASRGLQGRLPSELLTSTAETTMTLPLRSADRYRQATLDALKRLDTVLRGGEDPGEPVQEESPTLVSTVPSKEETQSSHAFTWVVVLLVVGTVVPMATWWVFSR